MRTKWLKFSVRFCQQLFAYLAFQKQTNIVLSLNKQLHIINAKKKKYLASIAG
jgi:hypothetical protein